MSCFFFVPTKVVKRKHERLRGVRTKNNNISRGHQLQSCFVVFPFFSQISRIYIYIHIYTECVKVPTRCLLITCRTNLYNFAASPKQQVFVPSLKQGMCRLPYYLHYTKLNAWNPTMMVSKRKPCHFPCQTLGGKLGGRTTHLKKYALQNGSLFCRSGFQNNL